MFRSYQEGSRRFASGKRSSPPPRIGGLGGLSGFTLIELLVVVAIIAILAAILFPVFAQAREKVRQAACLSNMKQIGLGMMMYTQDYDETLPFAAYNPPGQTLTMWYDLIEPYVRSGTAGAFTADAGPAGRRQAAFYVCPSFEQGALPRQAGDPEPVSFPAGQLDPAMSYAANGNVIPMMHSAFPGVTFPGKFTCLADMKAPAEVVLAAHSRGTRPAIAGDDWNSQCVNDEQGYPPTGNPAIGNASVYCAARYRHSGGSVYVLGDGHAKWFKAPLASWKARSTSGAAFRKSLAPTASAWFRED